MPRSWGVLAVPVVEFKEAAARRDERLRQEWKQRELAKVKPLTELQRRDLRRLLMPVGSGL